MVDCPHHVLVYVGGVPAGHEGVLGAGGDFLELFVGFLFYDGLQSCMLGVLDLDYRGL